VRRLGVRKFFNEQSMSTYSQHRVSTITVPILTYHNVSERPQGVLHPGLYLHPAQFRRQLAMLRLRGYRGVSIEQALPYLRGEKRDKVAVISFDDGYRDNLQHALPLLREFGFSATCYLVADRIGSYNEWDAELLRVRKPLMTLAEIKSWLAAGMHVGSHTCTHPHLSALAPVQKRGEIIDSKARLESLLGIEIRHLCYPYGDYDEDCVVAAKEAGYQTAVTTRRGLARSGSDLLSLPRLGNSGKKPWPIFFARTLAWSN
jgi:peptidoglycan/xylan/chitin deacetylase (PgdA/CDA1 family)